MKIILFLLSLGLYFSVSAQNWLPIDTNKIYHFNNDSTDLITKSVSSYISNDSTFFTTTIVKCDTCFNNSQYDRYQADFLGFYMLNEFDTTFTFFGRDTFKIETNKQLGESWNYNSNKTAIVIDEIILNIDTLIDSVKVVWLGNTDTLIISKNYGILKIPFLVENKVYDQIGIKDIYGAQELNFWEVYNFEVGNIFQYRIYTASVNNEPFGKTKHEKIIITGKTTTPNGYDYTIEKKSRIKQYGSSGIIPYYYYFSSSDTLSFSNNDSILNKITGNWTINIKNIYSDETLYVKPTYFIDDQNILTKYFDSTFPNAGITCYLNYCYLSGYSRETEYKSGLGKTKDLGYFFEHLFEEELIGYYKGTDTVGTIYKNEFYVGIQETINLENSLFFHPNPAQSNLQIEIKTKDAIRIEILDLQGNICIQELIKEDLLLDVSSLSSGLYFFQAYKENEYLGSNKLLID